MCKYLRWGRTRAEQTLWNNTVLAAQIMDFVQQRNLLLHVGYFAAAFEELSHHCILNTEVSHC